MNVALPTRQVLADVRTLGDAITLLWELYGLAETRSDQQAVEAVILGLQAMAREKVLVLEGELAP